MSVWVTGEREARFVEGVEGWASRPDTAESFISLAPEGRVDETGRSLPASIGPVAKNCFGRSGRPGKPLNFGLAGCEML